uniref:Uncharacterized protein n=1 Tax=Triticum urartu TaxID=4572 RepID=A0A8R7PFU4_TRIUA
IFSHSLSLHHCSISQSPQFSSVQFSVLIIYVPFFQFLLSSISQVSSSFCFFIIYFFNLVFKSSLVTFHSNPSVLGLAIFCPFSLSFAILPLSIRAGVVWTLCRETKNRQVHCF